MKSCLSSTSSPDIMSWEEIGLFLQHPPEKSAGDLECVVVQPCRSTAALCRSWWLLWVLWGSGRIMASTLNSQSLIIPISAETAYS